MLNSARKSMWRRMPPAVFPPLLGLVGLTIGFRLAGDTFGFGPLISEVFLAVTIFFYVFFTIAYMAKFIAKPSVVLQDISGLAGRAGLAAMTLAGLLIAAALAPYVPILAKLVLVLAFGGHLILLALVIYVLWTGPQDQKTVTPAWHLTFVGFVATPFAAFPLGMISFAQVFFLLPVIFAAVLICISLDQARKGPIPPPMRPLIAIHLAPVSLFASAANILGHDYFAIVMALCAIAFVAFLILKARWITAAGFTPLWGAFTFPSAAFAVSMLSLSHIHPLFKLLSIPALAAATVIVVCIAARLIWMCVSGVLAEKTNAATV